MRINGKYGLIFDIEIYCTFEELHRTVNKEIITEIVKSFANFLIIISIGKASRSIVIAIHHLYCKRINLWHIVCAYH